MKVFIHILMYTLFVPSHLTGQIIRTKEAASHYFFSSFMEMIRSRICIASIMSESRAYSLSA